MLNMAKRLGIVIGVLPLLCGPGAAQQKAATKDKPEANWKTLFDGKSLTGWKSTPFGGEGKVYVKDGAIRMEIGGDLTGVTWTGKPPRSNYEISLEGMRIDGADFFCTTTFPVGQEYCSLVVGGWGGSIVGLSSIDSCDASENATTKVVNFQNKRWYRVRIRVADAKIEAWIDGRQIVDQSRVGKKFSLRSEVELTRPLGIAAWQTTAAVRNVRMRKITPPK